MRPFCHVLKHMATSIRFGSLPQMDICKIFGQNVRRCRIATGISQEALAVKIGVDQAYISIMESGQQNVTLTTLWLTANALGVTPSELLDEIKGENSLQGKVPRKSRTRRFD